MACCFRPKDPLKRFLSLGAHFAILPDGRILQLHPVSALVWASNGFNNRSVAVEFAGNFPNTRGRWWKGETYGANRPTAEQFASGRALIRHLIRTIGLTHVVAHRQSSGTRENDPGPDIWYQVGQWAVDNLGLKDGGPGFKVGTGNPIPAEWRTWGQRPVVPEVSTAFEAELPETEIAHDAWQGTDWEDALVSGTRAACARDRLAVPGGRIARGGRGPRRDKRRAEQAPGRAAPAGQERRQARGRDQQGVGPRSVSAHVQRGRQAQGI